ncbi:MAG TPA: GlsB/YeaQ/YmgE family stress response membrane protein [Candidatus Dormibacteraeota bacterium]|nr:GlsB/YeaQ/YmgE family stress response membrane protein [Candidatus Dormibacteraeota bacterium]
MVVNLDFDTILLWLLVGVVAGFFASHIALGHGLGIIGDVVVGIIGAFIGGFLSGVFHWSIVIAGHPIITAMIMAFLGAVILLIIVRILGFGRGARRRPYWS